MNSFHFPFSLQGRKVLPRPLKDGLRALLPFQLGSASLSPSSASSSLPASPSSSSPCSSLLPQLLQLPGHHHPGHHRLVPLSFTVHRYLCLACMDVYGFTAQTWEGLSVSFYQSKFEHLWITLVLRMMNCRVLCKCIGLIFVLDSSPVLVTSAICRVSRLSPVVSHILTTKLTLTFVNSSAAMVSQPSSRISTQAQWTVTLRAMLSGPQVTSHHTPSQRHS